MKKLFALFTVILFAGFMMAQNTATVNTTGNDNKADVNQTGSNNVLVDQLNSTKNEAKVNQSGTNEAYLTQGMVENYYDAPYSISTNMPASNNLGTIDQLGTNNYLEIVQVGDNNKGSLNQNGNNNIGYIYQGWPFGFWGETAITSALSSDNSIVEIEQLGDANRGLVWQYGGTDNEVKISQNGNSNISQIAQGFIYNDANYDFTHPVYNTANNYAIVNQFGDNNSGKLFQLGNDNSFVLTQNGDGNTVGGRGLSGLEAVRNGYFAQDGNFNTFVGEQNDGSTLDDASFQFGDYNAIDLLQGAGDISLIQQTGDSNTTTISQYGGGQDASVIQTGNNNTATVTQQ